MGMMSSRSVGQQQMGNQKVYSRQFEESHGTCRHEVMNQI